MAPTYELKPGKRVGIFELGDSLWHLLDILRTDRVTFPKLEVSWDEETSPITVHIPQPPLTLFFEASSQRLSLIAIPFPSPLTLTYDTQVLAGPTSPLTRTKVGRILGPTHDRAGDLKLAYPGVEFTTSGTGGRDDSITKIRIAPRLGEAMVPEESLQSCSITPGQAVTLHFNGQEPLEVIVGKTTSQDLLVDIGAPLRKYWKEDDRMDRMWGEQNGESSRSKGQCFWNYFQHGLDFLIDADGVVIKIIAHSNIPGTPLFQRYARCPWTIPTASESLTPSSPLAAFRSALGGMSGPPSNPDEIRLLVPDVPSGGKKKKRSGSSMSATSTTSASEPKATSRERENQVEDAPEAMYLDRLGEGGLDGVRGLGGSRLIGFDGLVVEEDQERGGICSVLIYEHPPSSRG